MSYIWRIFKAITGVTLSLGVAYFLYTFSTAEDRVRALCPQIESGMSLAALQARVTGDVGGEDGQQVVALGFVTHRVSDLSARRQAPHSINPAFFHSGR